MGSPHLADRNRSQLVLVDIQEKLCAAMPADGLTDVLKHCAILLQAAALLEIPCLYTEQYPKGLGPTHGALMPWLTQAPRIEKTAFSCLAVPAFRTRLIADRTQIVLVGMEAHICILQTALDLLHDGYQVIVLEDAVLSRNPVNRSNALARLRAAGVIVSTTESTVFEWLNCAEGDAFKQISRLVR